MLQKLQILNDKDIDAGLIERPHQIQSLLQFPALQQRIDRRMNLGAVEMGVAAKPGDFIDRIARRRTGAERRPCDINGIGTTVDRCDADIRCSRRREKLKPYLHLSWVIW